MEASAPQPRVKIIDSLWTFAVAHPSRSEIAANEPAFKDLLRAALPSDAKITEKVDTQKIAAMRAEKIAQMQQVGDAIQQAVIEAHDVLTPAQRKVVADYVRSHRPGPGAQHGPNAEGAE